MFRDSEDRSPLAAGAYSDLELLLEHLNFLMALTDDAELNAEGHAAVRRAIRSVAHRIDEASLNSAPPTAVLTVVELKSRH
jgi:hypothetical protein